MARISGVDLPREKRVEIGLTYIYGIGRTSSNRILAEAGVNPDTRVKDLTDDLTFTAILLSVIVRPISDIQFFITYCSPVSDLQVQQTRSIPLP